MKKVTDGYATITVKRPEGSVETITVKSFDRLNDILFSKIQKATKEAGKGDVLSYKNVNATYETEKADYSTTCDRCAVALDTRTAKNQLEWMYFGGTKIRATTYYCNSCFNLLASVGAGEKTELEERAGYIPSPEPLTKDDF